MTAIVATTACSALVSTTGLTGGASDGGGLTSDAGMASTVPDEGTSAGDAGNGDDATVGGSDAQTQDGEAIDAGTLPDGSILDAGQGFPIPDGGLACAQDLSNIGTGDFHIVLILSTTQSGTAALVNQRATCVPATFWDLRLVNGGLKLETDDVSNYSGISTSGPALNDGAPHTIEVARVSGAVTLTVDGASEGSGNSGASFGALAPLRSGVDVCDGQDETAPLMGTIAALCVAAH